ncbi:MAG TPA: DUF2332 domain-containing protein [Chloroflexia bacterium]|nr:DUF2332 domain-containing protein [Chloroflexia bacterium]
MNTPDSAVLDDMAARFIRQADNQFHGYSPLYERLARGAAGDPAVLALAAHTRPGQIVPLMLFGAVHDLLLSGVEHPLAAYYRSLTAVPRADGDAYPLFHDFCLEHWEPIQHIIATRLVQTNEVGRCAVLLPAFGLVAATASNQPMALVEIGASAGLNLLWDRYAYDYGTAGGYGDPAVSPRLACDVRGTVQPPIPVTLPPIESRVGIDLHPIDVRDPSAAHWLRALIWPEHAARAANLQAAIRIAQAEPPPLVAGDVLAVLPDVLASVPRDATLCLFHSYVLGQLPQATRDGLAALIADHGQERDLHLISIEWLKTPYPRLEWTTYRQGTAEHQVLANCHQHGEWVDWLAGTPQ